MKDARDPVLLCAHQLRVRPGQPGFVVIETKDHNPRIAFLFDLDQAADLAEEMELIARGAKKATPA